MDQTQKLLISVQGTTEAQYVLESFTLALQQHSVSIKEMHHLNFQNAISLLMQVDFPAITNQALLIQELKKTADSFGLILVVHSPLAQPITISKHRYILTLLSEHLPPSLLTQLFQHLRQNGLHISRINPLDADDLHVFEIKIHANAPIDRQKLMGELLKLKSKYKLDLALQADDLFRRNKRLIFLDADMTFIQQEMIDEISRLAGTEEQVAQITQLAMNGEIDFQESLRQRVALLKGVRMSDLERIILNIPYTPGVERLVYILKTMGYQIGIVSGGFTHVIDHIKKRFDLDYGFANTLEVKNGELTGILLGDILDGHQKGVLLREVARTQNILPEQVIAVGDGANDLEMLSCASLGIAFNAKRFLRERAAGSLSIPNLDALLYFLGISKNELNVLFPNQNDL